MRRAAKEKAANAPPPKEVDPDAEYTTHAEGTLGW